MIDRRIFLTFAASLPWLPGCSQTPAGEEPAPEESAAEPQPLFNGRDLSGWEGDTSLWLVEDGEIVGRSPGIDENVFLATMDRYEDFVLDFEVLLVDDQGNSGVQFRSERDPDSTEMIGYQADIGPSWWGNLYDESRRRENLAVADAALIDEIVRKGDWNQYQIQAQGPRIDLAINGRRTVEYVEPDDAIPRSGRIALQIHSGPPIEVRFRRLLLTAL